MADQPVTREKLINADKDVQVIEDFIKKPKDETVTTRFGDEIMTLKGLEEEVKKSGGYFKRYTSLAAANADLANIPVDSVVKVTDAVDGGDYEKPTAEASTLTKSAYDPLAQAKKYTVAELLKEKHVTGNDVNDLFVAFSKFLTLYDANNSTLLESKDVSNTQHAINQKILSLITESNDGLGVGNRFASDVLKPTDKFGVDKGTLKGVVLTKSTTASTDFDYEAVESPYIIFDEKLQKFVMVYTAYAVDHSASSIGWATSDDLITWSKQGELIKPSGLASNGDQYGMTGPAIYYYDGLYYLYYLGLNGSGYEGEPINMCLATTASLTSPSWTYRGIKIPIQSSGWANEAIYHANIFTYNNKWWIFFNARGSIEGVSAERFGYATSDSIDGDWTVSSDRVSKNLEVHETFIRAADPAVFEFNGLLYVFFFSITTTDNSKAVDQWGWTTPSEFPNGWRYGGELLDTTPTYQSSYAHKPFVIKYNNVLYHYYTAVGDQGRCIALKTYDLA